jgi:hypothetical protein
MPPHLLRDEVAAYLSIPGALCMVAGGWLWLAANHCSDEARRVSQAYVLDSLTGACVCGGGVRVHAGGRRRCVHVDSSAGCWLCMLSALQSTAHTQPGRVRLSTVSTHCRCALPHALSCSTRKRKNTYTLAPNPTHADARKVERLLPMLVALRGRVDSPDPKQCELSDRKAVIHEV